MIISHLYRLVFIHIPKAAGTYVTSILFQLDPNCINYIRLNSHGHMDGHIQFVEIMNMPIYDQIKDYTFFCVIKDPIKSLISLYNYVQTIKDTHYLYNKIKDKTFYESLNGLFSDVNNFLFLNYIKKVDVKLHHQEGTINTLINDNIVLLNFIDINIHLHNFLSRYIQIPESINFNIKINESTPIFKPSIDMLNITRKVMNRISRKHRTTLKQNIDFLIVSKKKGNL